MAFDWKNKSGVYVVSKEGDDSNSGNNCNDMLDAKLTIASALSASSSGDTIAIDDGTFVESVDLSASGKTIKIIGISGNRDTAIINPSSGDAVVMGDGCILQDLTAVGGTGSGDAAVKATDITNPQIINVFADAPSTTGVIDALQGNSSKRLKAVDCYFRSTWDGVVLNSASGFLFRDCVFETIGTHASSPHQTILASSAFGVCRNCLFLFDNITGGNTVKKVGTNVSEGCVFIECDIHIRPHLSTYVKIDADATGIDGSGTFIDTSVYVEVFTSTQTEFAVENGQGSGTLLDNVSFGHAQTVDGTFITKPVGTQTGTVDIGLISGNATAATKLALSADTMTTGTVDNGTLPATATVIEADDITEATTSHYVGLAIRFTSGTLAGQAREITAYSLQGSNGRFTTIAFTEAPADNDTFIII